MQAIVANPLFELVGCYAWSADKVGEDVGELCGLDPLGVIATDDVDALLALQPDCVVYNPMWSDTDELVRILSAGVNVVSTAAFITGAQPRRRSRPHRRRRANRAGRRCSDRASAPASPSCWRSCRRPSATASTR